MKRWLVRWHVLALLGVVLAGLGLRGARLGRHYFWYDEALILNPKVLWLPAPAYANYVWGETTYNPGWPLVVWAFLRTFGDRLTVARVPSCLAGTLAVAAVYGAARAVRLDRPAALLAALFTALSWTQVEYSQQVLPYAAAPLLSAVCLALAGLIDRTRPDREPLKAAGLHLALAATWAVSVAIHNAFLLLLPVLAVFLGLGAIWPERDGAAGGRAPRVRRAALAAGALALLLAPAAFFYGAKRGEGFRAYLGAYYLGTFRGSAALSPPCYLNVLDSWYKARVPSVPAPSWDVPYFLATRTVDWLALNLNPRFSTAQAPSWMACALPTLGLFGVGAVALLRGRWGRPAARLAAGGAAGAGLAAVLSCARMYPYGGVRQMLPLAPLVALAAAAGARRLWALSPRGAGGLTAALVAVVLLSVPDYFAETRTMLEPSHLHTMMRRTRARAVVAGDGWWSVSVLRYLGHAMRNIPVIQPTEPEFAALLRDREPFVLVCLKQPLLRWDPERRRWEVEPALRRISPAGFDVSDYTVEPLMGASPGGVVQPASAFSLRPAPRVTEAGTKAAR